MEAPGTAVAEVGIVGKANPEVNAVTVCRIFLRFGWIFPFTVRKAVVLPIELGQRFVEIDEGSESSDRVSCRAPKVTTSQSNEHINLGAIIALCEL